MSNPQDEKLQTMLPVEVAKLYQKLFCTVEGKLVLQDLKNRCFFDVSTYNGDPNDTIKNEGMRSVVLHINNQIIYKEPENEMEPEQ